MGDILKKIFEIIGFLSLVCFSFFYTNKISTVIKENDDILKQIKEVKEQYEIKSIDAVISNDEIVPGVSGSVVDINSSYMKMKKANSFNANLLVYKSVKPSVSVNNVYDKYIVSGNRNKKEVSIIFVLENNENIENIINTLNNYNVKTNFFVNITWFDNNNSYITKLINEDHIVGSILINTDYTKSNISWMNAIITKINNQSSNYCYNKNKDNDFLNLCKLNNAYTIVPSIEAFDNPLIQVKSNILNGSIISFKVNDKLETELPLIIEYIKSKGYNIVTLEKLLDE